MACAATSIAAVSITSWLVAPKWTERSRLLTAARSRARAGRPEFRAASLPCALGRSKSSARQASAIASAAPPV